MFIASSWQAQQKDPDRFVSDITSTETNRVRDYKENVLHCFQAHFASVFIENEAKKDFENDEHGLTEAISFIVAGTMYKKEVVGVSVSATVPVVEDVPVANDYTTSS